MIYLYMIYPRCVMVAVISIVSGTPYTCAGKELDQIFPKTPSGCSSVLTILTFPFWKKMVR